MRCPLPRRHPHPSSMVLICINLTGLPIESTYTMIAPVAVLTAERWCGSTQTTTSSMKHSWGVGGEPPEELHLSGMQQSVHTTAMPVGTNQGASAQWATCWEPGGLRVETKVVGPVQNGGCLFSNIQTSVLGAGKWPRNLAATTITHRVAAREDYGRTAQGPRGEVSTKHSEGGMTTTHRGIGGCIPYQSPGLLSSVDWC